MRRAGHLTHERLPLRWLARPDDLHTHAVRVFQRHQHVRAQAAHHLFHQPDAIALPGGRRELHTQRLLQVPTQRDDQQGAVGAVRFQCTRKRIKRPRGRTAGRDRDGDDVDVRTVGEVGVIAQGEWRRRPAQHRQDVHAHQQRPVSRARAKGRQRPAREALHAADGLRQLARKGDDGDRRIERDQAAHRGIHRPARAIGRRDQRRGDGQR